ncbi:MAG: glycosyltransferase [Candidatus Hydrogenedentota bacterium]
MKTVPLDERIPPVRGLVPLHNRKGKPLSFLGVARALRLNRVVYKTEKIDVLFHGPAPSHLEDIVRFAADVYDTRISVPLHLAISVRTDAAAPPPDLTRLKERGLRDVHLAMPGVDMPHYAEWLAAARAADLPVRLQVQPPFPEDFEPEAFAREAAQAGAVAAVVILADPFLPKPRPIRNRESAQTTVAAMNRLAKAFAEAGIESTLYGLPLCHVSEENRGRAGNSALFFRDHQQYVKASYSTAQKLYGFSPAPGRAMVTAYLARYTHFRNPVDDWLLEWLVEKRQFLYRVAAFIRKTIAGRERGFIGGPKAHDPATDEPPQNQLAKAESARLSSLGPVCSACGWRRICDHKTKTFSTILPNLDISAEGGEDIPSPFTLTAEEPKYYDAIDETRLNAETTGAELAEEANRLVINTPPSRVFGRYEIYRENSYYIRMPGAIRWYSVCAGEVRSGIFHWGHAPFTVAATFGGGIADYAGFAVGRAIRVVVPMDAFSHRIVLHVMEDGRYVLLRDGVPMKPVEFQGAFYVPVRLPTVAQLRFSLWNIDEAVCTQNLQIWEAPDEPSAVPDHPAKLSIIIVSTRFTRRLQAVLLGIAHQQGVDLADMEVVVGYVPGVDATDDLLNSIGLAYPELRIVRSAFPAQNANSKGLIINESIERSRGEWIMILDSDIVLPPDIVARLLALEPGQKFAAPEGRKMLTREATAQILLGGLRPWECWQEIMEGPGEFRDKGTLPVGFCQCARRECFETIRYNEYDHFEGADWEFAIAMNEHFGPVSWLEGPAMHLDHGGSQWYGAQGHM